MDRSRIRGPYVRFCERDEASLISPPHPTRFCPVENQRRKSQRIRDSSRESRIQVVRGKEKLKFSLLM